MIERWLERRAALHINGRHRVFCTLDGKPLKTSYVGALLPRLARKAGIEKRVHAYGLRHTHAAALAREGIPMNVIQAQLGHSNLGTTSRYLAHIAPAEVIQVMQGREWEV
jgi:site-specific recombinase XerD